jgi:hypothetical protein
MATDLKFEGKDPCSHHRLKDLSEHQYLKPFVPLGLRRSISLEDTSIDNNLHFSQKSKTQNSSLKSLCVHLRPYQLLPEFNSNVAQLDDQHQFDWWKTFTHLKPFIQNIILHQQFTNHFQDDHHQQDQYFIQFQKCKRNGRRNGICFAIDRLCYHEQTILFVNLSSEFQIQYNLMSSGFEI